MKKIALLAGFLSASLVFSFSVFSQSAAGSRGQSINGSTGLFYIPSGRIGWEEPGNFAADFGYRAIINNDAGVTHVPAVTMSLFKWAEISTALDIQPDFENYQNNENIDLLLGLKVKLPLAKNTAIAAGGNIQLLNLGNGDFNYYAYQPYIAVTYPGNFFNMKAETTVVFGKTFYSDGLENNNDIDFGMGFDIILFPDVFGNIVHWIADFANYSYSDNAWPHNQPYNSSVWWRGVMNTGFRIDLSAISVFSKFKFLIDVIFNDLFDDGGRSFTVGAVFGFSP